MACNIHTRAEQRVDGKWRVIPGLTSFRRSHYGVYGFLADVRNYSAIPPISEQRGIPADAPVCDVDIGDHSFSWLSIDELLAFNYDAPVEDRRVTRQYGNHSDGSVTAEPGGGEMTTYRKFLGGQFVYDIEKLKLSGAERIVFGFDD